MSRFYSREPVRSLRRPKAKVRVGFVSKAIGLPSGLPRPRRAWRRRRFMTEQITDRQKKTIEQSGSFAAVPGQRAQYRVASRKLMAAIISADTRSDDDVSMLNVSPRRRLFTEC